MRLTRTLVTVTLCLLALHAAAQHQAGGPASFVAPVIPSVNTPIRVTFIGTNFSEGTAFRLTQNTTRCNEGTLFSPSTVPPGTISNVAKWTKHDPSSFYVATFVVGQPGQQVHACYTRDGQRWHAARNNRDRLHFHIWRRAPTVTEIVPLTAAVGQPLYLKVPGLLPGSKAALTTRQDGCDGVKVANAIPGANVTTYDAHTEHFAFTVHEAAEAVYLCVASPPSFADWSLVPYDPAGVVSSKDHVTEPRTGRLPIHFGKFAIHPVGVLTRRGELYCTPFVEGAQVTCQLGLNDTSTTVTPSDITFSRLKDGGGVSECPFPAIRQIDGSTTRVSFQWTPQRFGRGGEIGFLYQGTPLLLKPTPWSVAWFEKGNITRGHHPRRDLDDSFHHFNVRPGFSMLHSYGHANLIDTSYFGPTTTTWRFQRGVPGSVNATTAGEVLTASLTDSVTTGTVSRATSIPAGSTTCQAHVKYYYSAENGFVSTQSIRVGTVEVARDATTLRTFDLYATGASVAVRDGTKRRGTIDGDMRTWETLGVEIPVDMTQHSTITMTLTAEQTAKVRKLYFSDITLKCSGVVRTPANEVAALQRIYTHVGGSSSTLTSWRDGGNFNGDPCVNHWKGVTCRNMHVVELDLSNAGLSGTFPQVPELSRLERLSLKHNSLKGWVPSHFANLTKLQHVDLSRNAFEQVPESIFNGQAHVCLKSLLLRHNQLRRFPAHTQHLKSLEHLDLAYNTMVDSVSDWSSEAPLVHLDVSHNSLHGPLPQLPLHALVSADFGSNQFNGTVPVGWAALRRVEYLDVSKNKLTGAIPLELSKIRSAPRLTFRAEENYFVGLLPNLGFATVDVRDNIFACPLPKEESFVLTSHYGDMTSMQCDWGQIIDAQ